MASATAPLRVGSMTYAVASGRPTRAARRVSAHPPARLIGHHPVGLTHGLADGLVDRLAASGGPQHGVDTAAPTEGDAKQALQAAGDLAVR